MQLQAKTLYALADQIEQLAAESSTVGWLSNNAGLGEIIRSLRELRLPDISKRSLRYARDPRHGFRERCVALLPIARRLRGLAWRINHR